jgi:phosphate:Na+ symporter
MKDAAEIKLRIADMAQLALSMWKQTFAAFMEHDLDILAGVLEDEHKLNDMEKQITTELIAWNRDAKAKEEKSLALIYADVVGDLELIGDYCKDVLERVQIKIEEKLLFSDEAVKEYELLYRKTEDALDEVALALKKDNMGIVKEVLKKAEHIDSLVDQYRTRHNERLVAGVCSPMACNMFLNMLDFTAAIYYHTKKIAKSLLKIK